MGRSSKQKASGFLREWMDTGTPEPDTPKLAKLNRRCDRLRGEVQRLETAVHESASELIEHGAVLARKQVVIETGRKTGGDETGRARKEAAMSRHAKILSEADKLLKSDTRDPRSVASTLSKRKGFPSASTIRRVLAKARKTRTR
jgi:hypothetical protein